MIDRIFDMMDTWPAFGQAIFILIILCLIWGLFQMTLQAICVLVRGWNPYSNETEDDEEEEESQE